MSGPVKGTGPGTFPAGECTRFADDEYHKATGWYVPWSGDAYQWANQAKNYGWTVSSSPTVPSIICIQPGVQGSDKTYGHVAIVTSVVGSNIVTQDLNWGSNPGQPSTVFFTTGPGISFIYATDSSGNALAADKSWNSISQGSGSSIRDTLDNVPGFLGLFEALDQAEQFTPLDLSAITGAGNLLDISSETIQQGITFIVQNSTAFSLRATIVLVGLILLIAISINAVTEVGGKVADSGIVQSIGRVAMA